MPPIPRSTMGDRLGRSVLFPVLLASIAACEQPTSETAPSHELLELGADNVVFGMVSFLTSNGVREGRVEADTAFMFADSASGLSGATGVYKDWNELRAAVAAGQHATIFNSFPSF